MKTKKRQRAERVPYEKFMASPIALSQKLIDPQKDVQERWKILGEVLRASTCLLLKSRYKLEKSGFRLYNLSILSKLSILLRHRKMLRKEPTSIKELFIHAVYAFINLQTREEFFCFIYDAANAKNSFLSKVANHNLAVFKELKKLGIDVVEFFAFGKEIEFKAASVDRQKCWKRLDRILGKLEKAFRGHELYGCVRKDIIAIRKEKSRIWDGDLKGIEFSCLRQGLGYLNNKDSKVVLSKQGRELLLKIGEILNFFVVGERHETFAIDIWPRNPADDLFQGNFSNCCIQLGDPDCIPAAHLAGVEYRKYPAGVLDFLFDVEIQVATVSRIVKGGGRKGIGQCWLFITKNNGKPALIVDSFELNDSYSCNRDYARQIRIAMFRFLHLYAKAIGITGGLFLAKEGQVVNWTTGERHKIGHSVNVNDLSVETVYPIEKVGGYWNGVPYFLESRNGVFVYAIPEPSAELSLPITNRLALINVG